MTEIPKSHPRYTSLMTRERIAEGVRNGITSVQGLIAQGRGEAFDYILGERTMISADRATLAAAAALLIAKRPAISVNGNVAALVPGEMVELASLLNAPLEVNLFHRSEERVRRIADLLRSHGARLVLGENPDCRIPGLEHSRALATRGGIYDADAVLIPLEDGDRCEALVGMGKTVIAVDLNPLSRTSMRASITIVDNITRAVPNLTRKISSLSGSTTEYLQAVLMDYSNRDTLRDALLEMREYITARMNELDGAQGSAGKRI
ncbi:MAG: 4-phosphopantoate--beta-alanine ligase [Methanothrix sp.]|uniref:4-phosphopantoate--beta-alanine ligase n=1 Tax=Methanothrix sp. TaxID=90426 RepID=UPI00247B8375|nr:4-phosphopantoate--beta-alanine ligase [Methanothrix sp.]